MDRLAGLDEDRNGAGWVEPIEQPPREDAAREVVDYGVHLHAAVVEEADQRRVDAPDLVRPRGANPDSGRRGVDANTAPMRCARTASKLVGTWR